METFNDASTLDINLFGSIESRYRVGFIRTDDMPEGDQIQGVRDNQTGEVWFCLHEGDEEPRTAQPWGRISSVELNTLYERRALLCDSKVLAAVPAQFVGMGELPADKAEGDLYILRADGPVAWGSGVAIVQGDGRVLYADRNFTRLTGLDGTGAIFGAVPSQYVGVAVLRVLDQEAVLAWVEKYK